MMQARFLILILTLGGVVPAVADDIDAEQLAFFETRIRPVLVDACYECHSSETDTLEGNLSVETRAGLLAGGDAGPAVVPGNVDGGTLLEALRHESLEMPPDRQLPDSVIADFEKWVAEGAVDPRVGDSVPPAEEAGIDVEAGRTFWAFQPLHTNRERASKNLSERIDRLILERLEEAGLSPGETASRAVLGRRLYFDLVGLPPTEAQLQAFLDDDRPDAYSRLVDSLLAAPAFGRRWGRHWLDLARFAESTGGGRSLLIDSAWRYRQWVIDAFNDDMPFDQQIREQIAGDLLPAADHVAAGRQMTATAFLALGPHNYENQDKLVLEMDIIDEQIDTVGRTFLAMTLGCARCHDHKFDPVPMRDYYALAGIFRSTLAVEHSNVSRWHEAPLPPSPAQKAALQQYRAQLKDWQQQRKQLIARRDRLHEKLDYVVIDDEKASLDGKWATSTAIKGFIGSGYRFAGDEGSQASFAFAGLQPGNYDVLTSYTPNSNRASDAQFELLSAGESLASIEVDQRKKPQIGGRWQRLTRLSIPANQLNVVVKATGSGATIADAVKLIRVENGGSQADALIRQLDSLEQQIADLDNKIDEATDNPPVQQPPQIVVTDKEKIGDCELCLRGDAHRTAGTVPRGFLQVASAGPAQIPIDQSGRLELANWISSPDNPLTARVIANRVWQKLFGVGIVRTVDNFGFQGERPSHPELLDELAGGLLAADWSLKKLIREIVLSDAYRRTSRRSERALRVDPENRLLASQNRRRLDAEPLRDAMLLISGELDRRTVARLWTDGLKSELNYEFPARVQSVHLPVFRNQLNDFLAQFDFPDPNLSRGRRAMTTLPTQALALLNSEFVVDRSRAAAERLRRQELDDEARIHVLYRRSLGRLPSPTERELALQFVRQNRDATPEGELAAWSSLCHAIFASLDFRYVE